MAMNSSISRAIEKNNEGVRLYQEGKIKEALNAFTEAIKFNAEYAMAYHHLGLLYYKIGNYREAVRNFLNAKALNYDNPQLDYYLKLAQKEVKDVDPFLAAQEVSDKPAQILCPECGEPISAEFAFCPMCKARLGPPKCRNCGATIQKEWKACPFCGRGIKHDHGA